jgi:hypothetical protein
VLTGGFRGSRARPASVCRLEPTPGVVFPTWVREMAGPLTPLSPPDGRQRLAAMPSARRPRPPFPSLREERWFQTIRDAFPRQGAFPGPFASPRGVATVDLAVGVFLPSRVSPFGLGPVHPPQPQPQMAFLDLTPLDDFCFQHEQYGHAGERLLLAWTAISRLPLPRAAKPPRLRAARRTGFASRGTRRRQTAPAGRPRASLRAAA